jgi:cytochrome P450
MNFARARLKQVREMRRKNPKATRKSIYGTNLFGMMLEAYEEGNSNMTKSQLLDQCKTMLIASDSPTSLLMIWTLTLLAMHASGLARALTLRSSRCPTAMHLALAKLYYGPKNGVQLRIKNVAT